jgi:hypothetical protein
MAVDTTRPLAPPRRALDDFALLPRQAARPPDQRAAFLTRAGAEDGVGRVLTPDHDGTLPWQMQTWTAC